MGTLTIGQLAAKADVNVETIRFYERKGIVPQPPRRESGYRSYPDEMVGTIRFIKHAQELGFSLRETKELLDLRHEQTASCRNVRERAQAKLTDVEAKIASLQRIRNELAHLIVSCDQDGPTESCPILKSINQNLQENL